MPTLHFPYQRVNGSITELGGQVFMDTVHFRISQRLRKGLFQFFVIFRLYARVAVHDSAHIRFQQRILVK